MSNGEIITLRNKKTGEIKKIRRKTKAQETPQPQQSQNVQEQNILGKLFNVPGATSRAAIREQPALAAASPALAGLIALTGVAGGKAQQAAGGAALRPDTSETFQQQAIGAGQELGGASESVLLNFMKGGVPSAAGFAADVVTDPMGMFLEAVTTPFVPATAVKTSKQIGSKFMRFIKPTVHGRKSARTISKFKNNARIAVDTIVDNKNALKYTSVADDGTVVVSGQGRVPANLDEFAQAIHQTKQTVFNKWNQLLQKAGAKGKTVDLTDVSKELRKIGSDKAKRLVDPDIHNYAMGRALELEDIGELSLVDAQSALKGLNEKLKPAFKSGNINTEAYHKTLVDNLIRNRIKTQIDNIVTKETGNIFVGLKGQYGALDTIENGVVAATLKDAKKAQASLSALFDVFSAGDVVRGVARAQPETVLKGGFQIAARKVLSKLNDPNVGIAKMFKHVDNMRNQGAKQVLGSLIRQSSGAIGATPRSVQAINNR